jgi:predicted DCC family thiol-disulfide oxidoreductase YuxK
MTGEPELDGLMVFDGVCNFCSGSVAAVLRMDRRGAIRFTPLQSPFGRAIAARHGLDVDNPQSFVFLDHGEPLEASDAMVALARRLDPPWRWLAVFQLVPRALRDGLYGLVARNRYRLLGKRDTCMVPDPAVRARFILEPPPGWR